LKQVTIKRLGDDGNQTVGELNVHDEHGNSYMKLATMELGWHQNVEDISCIPAGKYTARKFYSLKHKNCFLIMNVPDRTMIEIHAANFSKQLKGCVAVGTSFRDIDSDGEIDLLNSRIALNSLLKEMPDDFPIEIIPVPDALYTLAFLN